MRRLNLLTALSFVLAACDGGGGGDRVTGGAGAGGKAVGGAAGGASGRGSSGGGAGNGPGGAGGMAVGGAGGGGGGCVESSFPTTFFVCGVSSDGVCTDTASPPMCLSGQWVCPPGSIGPPAPCRCTGPREPGCTCTDTGWQCGTGGAGGRGGAGGQGGIAGAGGRGGAGGSTAGSGGVAGGGGAAGGGASGASGAAGPGGAAGAQPIAGGGTIQSLPLSTNDLVFDSTRGVLYASTYAAADAVNSVLTIDPVSATVTRVLPVGNFPSVLAISDDGSALYVGISTPAAPPTSFDRADSVLRIDLASMTAGPPVSLGMNLISKLTAGQIAAVPGSSTRYVVSRRQPGFQSDFAGLALYDGNTKLAEVDSFYGSGHSIAFINPSTLVGCSNYLAPSELIRYSVTSTAITPGTYVRDVIAGSATTRIAFGSGWIFASDGNALNATTLQPLGRYGGTLIASYSAGAPVPDPDGANVWFLSADATGMVLLDFDRTTFQLRRTISLGPLTGSNASALVRWSPTGFAFRTYEKLYLIKLPN